MINRIRQVGIVGTGMFMPPRTVTNADLEKIVDTNDEWIRSRTGIQARQWVDDPGMATSDMSVVAARQAMDNAGVTAEEIDLIIVGTVTPDYMFPSTASLVQDRLGASRAAAFDLEAGCTGFVYSLTVAQQFVACGTYDTVLVIGADILTRITNFQDRSTCVLFGDGAGAVVLRAVPEGYGLLSTVLGSDGAGGMHLYQEAGGSLHPASRKTVDQNLHTIQMSGNDVFKFAVRVMDTATIEALGKCGLTRENVDFLIPHQANLRIVEAARKRLKLPPEKVCVNVERYGNTSSATVPVALHESVRDGRIKHGDIVLFVAFGAGLTWGASVLRWWERQ